MRLRRRFKELFTVFDSDGNPFFLSRKVTDSDGNVHTVSKYVYDSDGNPFLIFRV